MSDFLTEFSLVGAAVLFAMWLALTGGRWLARQTNNCVRLDW